MRYWYELLITLLIGVSSIQAAEDWKNGKIILKDGREVKMQILEKDGKVWVMKGSIRMEVEKAKIKSIEYFKSNDPLVDLDKYGDFKKKNLRLARDPVFLKELNRTATKYPSLSAKETWELTTELHYKNVRIKKLSSDLKRSYYAARKYEDQANLGREKARIAQIDAERTRTAAKKFAEEQATARASAELEAAKAKAAKEAAIAQSGGTGETWKVTAHLFKKDGRLYPRTIGIGRTVGVEPGELVGIVITNARTGRLFHLIPNTRMDILRFFSKGKQLVGEVTMSRAKLKEPGGGVIEFRTVGPTIRR